MLTVPRACWVRVALALIGLAAVAVYLLPGLRTAAAHWPLWDVAVYWWGGRQALHGGALYAAGSPYSFTYPPIAAAVFALGGHAPESWLKVVIGSVSIVALVVLSALSLSAAGLRRRPEAMFAASAAALLAWPVAYTLHLGEINLILAALVAPDLLGRRDAAWWQGIGTGVAAGIKLTPLVFIVYLAITRRARAAVTAAGVFAATVAAGWIVLPGSSRVYWLGGVFFDYSRIGNPANPSDQSLAGAIARLAGTGDPPRAWWLAAAVLTGVAGLAVAAWAHRRGHRLAGVVCCAVTGLLVSPFSWTHHWVWAIPLLVMLAATAWRSRSVLCGLAVVGAAAIFSGQIPMPPAGPRPGVLTLLEGDLYVLCGLAVLAGTALVLALRKPAASRRLGTFRPKYSLTLYPREVTMRPAGTARSRLRLPLAIALSSIGAAALTACSGPAASHSPPAPTYYLALGDSLAQGVQPNAAGTSVETRSGYPDQVYAALRPGHPALRLVKLGCPSETTSTMIDGGICKYPGGSQLKAAETFLHAHRGRVLLVTIDIGANDPEACGNQPGFGQLASCAVKGIPVAVAHLTTIMARLTAAGPGVRMVGMNYYLPALAQWRNGLPGHLVAWAAERLAASYNNVLGRVYTHYGARVANVFGAFHTSDFAAQGTTPRNVALLCEWTWACAAPPRGPNQHANQAGYHVIARTFLQAAGLR